MKELDVVLLEARVRPRLIDGLLHRRVEEALDGRVEPEERHQHLDAVGYGLCRRLEGAEHRPLAASEVHARGPGLADRLEHLLDQLELVRRERVVATEVVGVLERAERHPAPAEHELVLQDVALRGVHLGQHRPGLLRLGEQPGLDHLVHVRAGQRQRGEEPAWIFEKSFRFAFVMSPRTVSMSSWR
ncbi:unnamed protein product [Gemmata massiliana]|uniref:Uncharacterized protein n=1 Tax=Gemmata massiliana TaxID=1210884 RepID=A0A6P2D4S7_9BACT|nr:unnamed protein product [Gemmata massiliana]